MRVKLLFLSLFLTAYIAHTQEIGYGFKVGLNFNSFNGPIESDASGNELEKFENKTGFHVGAEVLFKFTDLMGVKSGLLFYQRGGTYRYEGEGMQLFRNGNDNLVKAVGERRSIVEVTNSYLDVPILFYYRPIERIEVYGGGQISFLVGSVGDGDLRFDGTTVSQRATPVSFNSRILEYNFFKDEVPSVDELQGDQTLLPGEGILIPESLTAYYDSEEKDGPVYNFFDVGLQAGLNLFINQGLYVGFAANFGLIDTTRDQYDRSYQDSQTDTYRMTDDKDLNQTYQVSIGFSF